MIPGIEAGFKREIEELKKAHSDKFAAVISKYQAKLKKAKDIVTASKETREKAKREAQNEIQKFKTEQEAKLKAFLDKVIKKDSLNDDLTKRNKELVEKEATLRTELDIKSKESEERRVKIA